MLNRIEKIKSVLEETGAAVILNPSNRFYLTGFNSSDGVLYVSKKRSLFLTDSRYIEAAKKTVTVTECALLHSLSAQIKDLAQEDGITSLYLENDYVSIFTANKLTQATGLEFSKENILSETINSMRAVKTVDELKLITEAQELTDKTFLYALSRIEVGRTERDIMLEMEYYMRKMGSEGVAFDFIVASGKNSSLPHAVPTDKKIERGDFVTMDFGAVCGGYRSDMTRTVAVGIADERQRLCYNTVLSAQKAAISFMADNRKCSDVDKAARDVIDATEFKGMFGHALGHSVGIDIHESPACSPNSSDVLRSGMVMTAEPGIYIEDTYGVRIEDLLIITENGTVNLTKSKKDLIII